METPFIVALSGWKRSGKDTVADYLRSNYSSTRLAFADPLKDAVAAEFDLDRASIDNPELKEAPLLNMPVDPRDAYSRMIVEFMFKEFRTANGKTPDAFAYIGEAGDFTGKFFGPAPTRAQFFEPLFWTRRALCILKGSTMRSADADYWVRTAANNATENKLYVISDARYKNEINTLRSNSKGPVITIRINRFDSNPSNDPSENDLNDFSFDHVVENRGSLDQLYSKIDQIMYDIGIPKNQGSAEAY